MGSDMRDLILQTIDQTISDADFSRFQDALETDGELRSEYLRAVHLHETLGDVAVGEADTTDFADPSAGRIRSDVLEGANATVGDSMRPAVHREGPSGFFGVWPLFSALAATLLLLIGWGAYQVGHQTATRSAEQGAPNGQGAPLRQGSQLNGSVAAVDATLSERTADTDGDSLDGAKRETTMAGYATLRRSTDIEWTDGSADYRAGDVLPAGRLQFEAGIAEIDFFCGASLIVQGPAELELQSDWAARLLSGQLRANVPPAARGFVISVADTEIVDLGTEFAVEAAEGIARVEVVDGEIELRGGLHDGKHLFSGERRSLSGGTAADFSLQGLSTRRDIDVRQDDLFGQRLQQWRDSIGERASDPRLIALYPLDGLGPDRVVKNAAKTGDRMNGTRVGLVDLVPGRFGPESQGLEFDRPGSRIRVRIDGEFDAFSFVTWVKIDSLDHRYNALFMGDGYENGEPHWQIRDDGQLMFSVMVDDSVQLERFDSTDQQLVKMAGLHRVYFTDPIWDLSKSGQWLHIAAVYNPANREVVQYVNGRAVSREEITDEFYIDRLRIGPAEIGNWGQPFRKSPWFAVRNLNGEMGELAIYHDALDAVEIKSLYEQGKPLGY